MNIKNHLECLNFTPCQIHSGFRKGVNVYGEDAEELTLDLFQWFKQHTCQREDFSLVLEELELEESMFIRHVL